MPEQPLPTEELPPPEGPVEIVITAAGDVTLGGNMRGNPTSNMYTKGLAAHKGDLGYFFENVQDYFGQDDLTLVNFEGTLTTALRHKDNEFTFRAPPEHVAVLTKGSVEAVSFENNHAMDFYQQGWDDTTAALTEAGIVFSSEGHVGEYTVKGVSILPF
ncbi:hypothetical protein FACS1894196_3840 [Clostridia bacterium]|nr:hypothetical protein FACS1894196_3840 [Clostridia bacterium]